MQFFISIDATNGPANAHHHVPIIMLLCQSISNFWPNQFIGNGWHIRIADLQKHHKTTYIIAHLAEKYGVCERKVYKIVGKMIMNCTF